MIPAAVRSAGIKLGQLFCASQVNPIAAVPPCALFGVFTSKV